ncbi:hypothetical protein, partial [uncultured Methylibium sp.]|uniref:hypothetical protein n=1 Tax=uncultured Methylibium sp. TaxID=381093 RepID=UPI0025E5C4A3
HHVAPNCTARRVVQTFPNLVDHDPQTHFVLPDLAFLEMTKSAEWERTLKQSLSTLSRAPQRVHAAHSVNSALGVELRTHRSAAKQMMFPVATAFIRRLLAWVATGEENEAIQRIRDEPESQRASLHADYLNHPENKLQLAGLIEGIDSSIPAAIQKRMRANQVEPTEYLRIARTLWADIAYGVLLDRNVDSNKARLYLKQQPVYSRYIFLNVWYCMGWLARGGFDSLPEKGVTNEFLDHQYVITASSFHGLLTKETKTNEAYAALTAALREANPSLERTWSLYRFR